MHTESKLKRDVNYLVVANLFASSWHINYQAPTERPNYLVFLLLETLLDWDIRRLPCSLRCLSLNFEASSPWLKLKHNTSEGQPCSL